MEQLIALNLVIGDRTYRVRIAPNDEEVVRNSIKLINEKILEFKTQFAGKDMQDYIAMVLIWFATEQNASGSDRITNDNIQEKLSAMIKMIDNVLPGENKYSNVAK